MDSIIKRICMSIFEPSHIYNADTSKQNETEQLYTILGKEEYIDSDQNPRKHTDNNEVYAKKNTRIDGSVKYLIKTGIDKKLYNPLSPIDKESNRAFLDRVSRSNDRFRSVSQKTFNWYIQFLRTKNTAWLHNAEREAE